MYGDARLDPRVLLCAVCLAAVLLGGSELGWRRLGFLPSVADTPALWALHRARVDRDPRALALLGDSQMLLGFSVEVAAERLPDRPVAQLAINGRSPVPVLRDLAEDPDFTGTVVVGVRTEHFDAFNLLAGPYPQLAEYHERGRAAPHWPWDDSTVRLRIRTALQSRWALLRSDLGARQLLRTLLETAALPEPFYTTIRADRSGRGDFSRVDVARKRRQNEAIVAARKPPGAAERAGWDERVGEFKTLIERIHDRGGRVVLVRFPTSPQRYESEQRVRPRDQYFDRIADGTPAGAIHFRDVARLARFDPPDSDHLDHLQAVAFTNALLDELEARGLLADRVAELRR